MAAFEGWAVLELLGHRVRYGQVSEVSLFGEPFCRIDIPTDPPTTEFYSGKSIYGLRAASEDSIRAHHAPRKQLPAGDDDATPFDDEPDIDEFDADSGGQHDEDEDNEPSCAFCAEPLGAEPTQRVDTGPDGEPEIWHQRCAVAQAEVNAEVAEASSP